MAEVTLGMTTRGSEYERFVYERFKQLFSDGDVTLNDKVLGNREWFGTRDRHLNSHRVWKSRNFYTSFSARTERSDQPTSLSWGEFSVSGTGCWRGLRISGLYVKGSPGAILGMLARGALSLSRSKTSTLSVGS